MNNQSSIWNVIRVRTNLYRYKINTDRTHLDSPVKLDIEHFNQHPGCRSVLGRWSHCPNASVMWHIWLKTRSA